MGLMFKVTAEKTPTGNYSVAGTCEKGHTSYKKVGDSNSEYKCPYCGRKVH